MASLDGVNRSRYPLGMSVATETDRAERSCLVLSGAGNIVLAAVGLTIAVLSKSQAIMLDGMFNLIYFGTALFTLRVAFLVRKGDDARYPYGYGFFEPLVNGLKGVLILGVSAMALVGSLEALFSGGREIQPGLAVGYAVFATAAGVILAVLTQRGAKRSGSPLVKTDADGWVVNAAVSACVLVAFTAIFLIRGTSLNHLVPYVDPAVVAGVVLISIGVPVRMARNALLELLNRSPSAELVEKVTTELSESIAELPVQAVYVRVIQPGRTRMVTAHVVLPEDYTVGRLAELDDVRRRAQKHLEREHRPTVVDLFFTTDATWGKPTGD